MRQVYLLMCLFPYFIATQACDLVRELEQAGDADVTDGKDMSVRADDALFVDVSDGAFQLPDRGSLERDASMRLDADPGPDQTPSPSLQPHYLKAFNTQRGDLFAYDVAFEGDLAVVGAKNEDGGTLRVEKYPSDNSKQDSGAAYVFERSKEGSSWMQVAYLKGEPIIANDAFGEAVTLSGGVIAVGAPGRNDPVKGAGAVFLFERDEVGAWVQTAYLKASQSSQGDRFGTSLALDGSRLVVSAPHQHDRKGAVYVFEQDDAGTWKEKAVAVAPVRDKGDEFGRRVALKGDTLVISAHREDSSVPGIGRPGEDNQASESGAVYVLEYKEGKWSHQAYLKSSNPGENHFFGEGLALQENRIAVGAPGESSSSQGINPDTGLQGAYFSGAVYLFERHDVGWTQTTLFKSSNSEAGDGFGYGVGLEGDLLAVGAPGEASRLSGVNPPPENNGAPNSGAAYFFEREPSTG